MAGLIRAISDYLIEHRSNGDAETIQIMRETGADLVARFGLVLDEWEQKNDAPIVLPTVHQELNEEAQTEEGKNQNLEI